MLKLVKPNTRNIKAFKKVMKEFDAEIGTGLYTQGVLKMIHQIEEGQESELLKSIQQNDKNNLITCYWLMDDDNYIGCFTFSHNLDKDRMQRGGNLGYNILPSRRRQGYAYTGLKMVLSEISKSGFDKILITCGIDNEKSFNLIKKVFNEFGGKFLSDSRLGEHRVWLNTKNSSKVKRFITRLKNKLLNFL